MIMLSMLTRECILMAPLLWTVISIKSDTLGITVEAWARSTYDLKGSGSSSSSTRTGRRRKIVESLLPLNSFQKADIAARSECGFRRVSVSLAE